MCALLYHEHGQMSGIHLIPQIIVYIVCQINQSFLANFYLIFIY